MAWPGRGDQVMETVVAQGAGYRTPAYTQTGYLSTFNSIYYHPATAEELIFQYAGSISQQVYNPNSTPLYPNYTGNAGFSFSLNSSSLGTYYVPITASGYIAPHSTGYVGNSASSQFTLSLSVGATGQVSATSNLGSGPNLTTLESVESSFTVAPVGLTQSDPIIPNVYLGGTAILTGLPNYRWVDPPSASGYTYQVTSASTSLASITFPTGFGHGFHVSVNGVDYGPYDGGQTLALPAGTTLATVTGIDTSVTGYASELGFAGANANNASLNITPLVAVPEPSAAYLISTVCLAAAWRRLRTAKRRK